MRWGRGEEGSVHKLSREETMVGDDTCASKRNVRKKKGVIISEGERRSLKDRLEAKRSGSPCKKRVN